MFVAGNVAWDATCILERVVVGGESPAEKYLNLVTYKMVNQVKILAHPHYLGIDGMLISISEERISSQIHSSEHEARASQNATAVDFPVYLVLICLYNPKE